MSEPASVVVAKAVVAGEPRIEASPVGEVRVRAQQTLLVKFLYRFEEASGDREAWGFRLTSTVGRQTPKPAEAKWKDRRVLHDAVWGFVQQEYRFEAPGTFEGTFEAAADYSRGAWSGAAGTTKAAKIKGRFRVHVD